MLCLESMKCSRTFAERELILVRQMCTSCLQQLVLKQGIMAPDTFSTSCIVGVHFSDVLCSSSDSLHVFVLANSICFFFQPKERLYSSRMNGSIILLWDCKKGELIIQAFSSLFLLKMLFVDENYVHLRSSLKVCVPQGWKKKKAAEQELIRGWINIVLLPQPLVTAVKLNVAPY